MSLRIGVDVGGTNLRVGVVRDQEVIWEQRHQADYSRVCKENAPQDALKKIIQELARVLSEARKFHLDVSSIGIGFPGFIDPHTGVVSLSPNLPGLRDVDIAGPLAQRLGVPVVFENDALCAAYGEYLLMQPRPESLIYLGLGTGVGGGLILNGKPYPGQHGVSMEVGHIIVQPGGRECGCGNRGCLERYASASGVSLSYQELTSNSLDSAEIAARAAAGDAHAGEALRITAESLAAALAHILKVIDVGAVVIGGGLSAAWPQLRGTFDAALDAALIPALRGRITVMLARAGDQAGMVGAAWMGAGHERP